MKRRLTTAACWVAILITSALWLRSDARAFAPAGRYVTDPQLVVDTVSGLVWQRNVDPYPCNTSFGCTLAQAQTYCQNLSLGSYPSGWRVPALKELTSIVDYSRAGPVIDTNTFPNTVRNLTWTATPKAGDPNSEWALSFDDGTFATHSSANAYWVRCVH
jgi:hypothetical protein